MPQEDDAAPDEQSAAGNYGESPRAAEQRYQREFGHAPYGMVVASLTDDRPHTYLAVNDTFCELTGYSRQDVIGRDFLGDFHPEEQPALEVLIDRITSGASGASGTSGATAQLRIETRLVRKDGDIVFIRLTGSAIQPPSGERYLAAYIEDATAIEQARAEIRQLELELHRSRRLESVGQLVGGIAHDFNNLLTVISNYASLVRDEVSVAEAADSASRWGPVRWDVEQIDAAAERAKRLIRHLLATARKVQTKPQVVDLHQLVGDVTGLVGELIGEHLPVITRHDGGLWPVQADPGLLEQAITNIMVNARDAMPSGGQITIETANIDTAKPGSAKVAGAQDTAGLGELPPGHYVEIRITDTGAGMNEVIAERAFEPFFTTKAGDQAAGLGLSAVRMFATQAGGHASLRSEPGAGTTVTMILPAAAGSDAGATGSAAASDPVAANPVRTVIVVDDEPAIRDVAHRVLTSAGYQVVTARNGDEALDLLRERSTRADLILTDVVMPGITAKAFASQIQAARPGIPVLFMSGYERPGDIAGGWPDADTPVIAKPFSRAALLARVTQMLTTDANATTTALAARRQAGLRAVTAGRRPPGCQARPIRRRGALGPRFRAPLRLLRLQRAGRAGAGRPGGLLRRRRRRR